MNASIDTPATPTKATTLSLANSRLYTVALLISIVPLWLVSYLPMVDLPGHAALMTALKELAAGNGTFAAEFESNWFTPYLLGYGLLYAASLLVPIVVAAKIVVSASVVLTSILTGVLLREIGADERWKWLAIPSSYSLAFYWGFVSFIVAIPVGLVLLIHTVRFDRDPSARRGLTIAALALLAFFSHIIAMGFICLCALSYIAGARYRDVRGLLLRALPYTAPLPLIAIWFSMTAADVSGVANAPFVYGSIDDRLWYLISQPSGFDYVSGFGVVVTLSILLLPVLSGARWAPNPARWLPLVVGLVAFFVIPSYAFLSGFLYERLGVFLVPLWLMAWNPPTKTRARLDWIAMLVVVLWVATNTWRFASFARETQEFDAIVERMDSGKRVAGMIVDNSSPAFSTPVYLHFANWYQAKKHGIVDFNFADFQMVVQRTDTSASRVVEGLSWQPLRFDWRSHGGATYDYFLVRAEVDLASEIFKDHVADVDLVANNGFWWLYRNRGSVEK